MKRFRCAMMASLLLAGLFSFASGAGKPIDSIEVMGIVRDSVTQAAIPQVAVLLAAINPLTFNPNNLSTLKYDTLSTLGDGSFDYYLKNVDPNATILAYGVQKSGYMLKYGFTPITVVPGNPLFIDAIQLAPTPALATDILTVSGKIVDSATGQPVPNAVVAMSGLGNLDTINKSMVTGSDGTFSKQVSVTNDPAHKVLLWYVTKTGFNRTGGQVAIGAATTIDLGTIKLGAGLQITNDKDTLTVSGTVVDAGNQVAIANVKIVMSGLGADTSGNTATTGADGKFSKQVIVTNVSAFKALVYGATKSGYVPFAGQVAIASKTIDLGTIDLTATAGTINGGMKSVASITRANNMRIYSLRGQLLYAGAVIPTENVLHAYHTSVIVNYRCNNYTINSVRVVPAK